MPMYFLKGIYICVCNLYNKQKCLVGSEQDLGTNLDRITYFCIGKKCSVSTIITDNRAMKTQSLKRRIGWVGFLMAISLIAVQCNRNPCKDTACQNGGTPVEKAGGCGCNCPAGFTGNLCENRVDYMKCKINGVDYKAIVVLSDTTAGPQGTYRSIAGFTTFDTTDVVVVNFYQSLPVGTYTTSNFNFVGLYLKNKSTIYQSTSGTLVLTDITKRYAGTFNFTGRLTSSPQDSVVVTGGSFSLEK